jgi:hypothetical protein
MMHPNRAMVAPRSSVRATHFGAAREMSNLVPFTMEDSGRGGLAAVLVSEHLKELLPICEGVRVIVFLSVVGEISQLAVQATILSHASYGRTLCASLNSVHPRKHGNLTGFLYRSNGWSLENT